MSDFAMPTPRGEYAAPTVWWPTVYLSEPYAQVRVEIESDVNGRPGVWLNLPAVDFGAAPPAVARQLAFAILAAADAAERTN